MKALARIFGGLFACVLKLYCFDGDVRACWSILAVELDLDEAATCLVGRDLLFDEDSLVLTDFKMESEPDFAFAEYVLL